MSNTSFPKIYTEHMQIMQNCMGICFSCSKMCLEEGHRKTAALCAECGEVCALAIKGFAGQYEFAEDLMDLCAAVCERCGEECEKMEAEHCQECAEICRQCADVCSS